MNEDEVEGVAVTMIDNGMPCVILSAADMGISGEVPRATLDADESLKARLEAIRLACGPLMNLGTIFARRRRCPRLFSFNRSGQSG